jgi:hypothetical protein
MRQCDLTPNQGIAPTFIKTKRFWIPGVILTALHLAVTLSCVVTSFGVSMNRFDHPELAPDGRRNCWEEWPAY